MREQIHKPHKDAQVWTYGYDASMNRTGIATRTGIRQKAFDLLEVLVEMRKKWEAVRELSIDLLFITKETR